MQQKKRDQKRERGREREGRKRKKVVAKEVVVKMGKVAVVFQKGTASELSPPDESY